MALAKNKKHIPETISFHKGEVIFEEGQIGDAAYLIRKGKVCIYRSDNNHKVVLDHLGEGEIFGEMGIHYKGGRSTHAEAEQYTELTVINGNLIDSLVTQSPRTIQHLIRQLTKRLRQANDLNQKAIHGTSFLAICKLIELESTINDYKEKQSSGSFDLGVQVRSLYKTIKTVLMVHQSDIDWTIDKLKKLNIISISKAPKKAKDGDEKIVHKQVADKSFQDKCIKIINMKTFPHVVEEIYNQLISDSSGPFELELIDITELADSLKTTPEVLYKKMANEDIPESLFYFHRKRILEWANEQDEGFFNKVKRKKKTIKDCDSIEDIVYVDNDTIKKVFSGFNYYQLGVMVSIAEEEAQRKILSNLGKKMAGIIQAEMKDPDSIDPTEADNIIDEFYQKVRDEKGVSAG